MAHVLSIMVEGLVGNIKPVIINFNRGINLINGPNGCGKTSLLKILESAMSKNAGLLADVIFKRAEVEMYSVKYKKNITYTLDKSDLIRAATEEIQMDDGQVVYLDRTEIAKRRLDRKGWKSDFEDNDKVSWDHRYLPTSRLISGVNPRLQNFHSTNEIYSEEKINIIFADLIQDNWKTLNADVGRKIRQAQQTGLRTILFDIMHRHESPPLNDLSDDDISLSYDRVTKFLGREGSTEHLGELAEFKQRVKSDSKFYEIVNDIDSVERNIEQATMGIDRFKTVIESLWGGKKKIKYTERGIAAVLENGESIGIQHLSSGEKQIVRILLEAMLTGLNTLIIDEPEISIHVDWQKKMLGFISGINSKAQIIAATHSPELLASVEDEQIHMLGDT